MRDCGCSSHNGFLTAKGFAEAAQRELELAALDVMAVRPYLDLGVSVSALIEIENDCEYDPNHVELNRRVIHNGS